jgi:hypothetical protein
MTKFWENDLDAFLTDFADEASFRQIATIAVQAGGAGYSINDVLSLATPTNGTPATVKVTTVEEGIVTGVLLLTPGTGYSIGVKTTTVSPEGGSGCTINVLTLVDGFNVIFHNEYEAVPIFEGQIESRNPFINAKESDVADITHDTVLWINSVVYTVKSIQPDGTGMVLIELLKS